MPRPHNPSIVTHIAILTFDGFNELDSIVALGILNRVRKTGWRVSLASPTATVVSMNGVAVQAWGWHLPGLAGREIEFNPLAWQFLFLLGAWFGQRALRHGRAIGWHPLLFTAAILALAAGVVLRLAGGDLGFLTAKQNLGPARLLHGLALAYATVMLWQMREMRLK